MDRSNNKKSNKIIFLDTNIILDVLLKRKPHYDNAFKIFELCRTKRYKGCISEHSVPTIWYVIRKEYKKNEWRTLFSSVLEYVDISGMNKDLILKAISRDNFPDFEDCLQDECALQVEADCIITRNKNDFCNSKVPAFLPEEFLQQINYCS